MNQGDCRHLAGMLLLLATLVGCGPINFGPGLADFDADLGNGYQVYRSSAHQITVLPTGSNYKGKRIPAKIIELDHDGDFLIAKQQHLQRRSPRSPDDTYEEPVPDTFSYWILNLKEHELFGPLTVEQFDARRGELGVSESLALHDVYDYRPKQP